MVTSELHVRIASNIRKRLTKSHIAARQNKRVGRCIARQKPFKGNVIFICRIAEIRRYARIRHKRLAPNWTLSLGLYPAVYESAPHPEKPWNAKAMLTKPWENLHLSMDPLDRLTNDVYDCVTDEALGAGDRWGTRELLVC